MASPSRRLAPESCVPEPGHPWRPSRRTALGVGVASTAGLLLGAPAARAASSPAPAPAFVPAGPSAPGAWSWSDQHITFQRYNRTLFKRGTHQGIRWALDGIRMGSQTTPRSYTDPFGGGGAVAYDQASWTSPTVHTPFPLSELIASWDVDTPGGTWVEVLVRGTDEAGVRSGWYVLGRWCAKDPADGGAIHRTSVDGQATDLATVYTDTFHTYGDHRLLDYQLRINLLRPAGTRQTPV
ncbi:MAG: hypothetical protein ABI083_20055, partial [Lapillicoccus sp.]